MQSPSAEPDSAAGSHWVSTRVVAALCFGVAIGGVVLLYTLWSFWPDTGVAGKAAPTRSIHWFGWHTQIRREADFFLVLVVFPIVVAIALAGVTPWLKRRMHGRDV